MKGISGEGTNSFGGEHHEEVCAWCGKGETSSRWSMGGFAYCSFRCGAAGQYRNSLLIAVLLAPYLLAIVLFPQIMFAMIFAYTGGSTSSPNLINVVISGFLMVVFCAFSIGSLYAAYVGWSIRRMSDPEFIGQLSDTQRYPKREQYGETHHRCEWCEEPIVRAFWSGKKGKYCSFRCSAAGNYRSFLLMLFLVLALTSIPVAMIFIMNARSSITQIDSFLVLLLIILVVPGLSCAYVVYVGRSMNRTRQTNDS
ncbi:MAG: hypothetical protein RTU09_08520 [Candidatus Thorarchaeota archaeon]